MDAIEFINRNKNRLFNSALIIFALFISNKIYQAQNKTIESLRMLTEDAAKKNEVLKDIVRLETGLDSYKTLFNKKNESPAINILGNIARESNIKIVSIKPLPEQRAQEYIKIPFELTVSVPNYHALGKFISKIENQQDVYLVDSMAVNANSQANELNVNLKVSTVTLIP